MKNYRAIVATSHVITAEPLLNQRYEIKGQYVVPEGYIKRKHREGDIVVIDEMVVTSFSLVDIPTDPTLTPIEEVD